MGRRIQIFVGSNSNCFELNSSIFELFQNQAHKPYKHNSSIQFKVNYEPSHTLQISQRGFDRPNTNSN